MGVLDALSILLGAGAGVLVDKVVGDGLKSMNVANPAYSTVQTHDVILVALELLGAYAARKNPAVRNGLVAMAGAIITTDIYEAVNSSGQWLAASPPAEVASHQPTVPAPPGRYETQTIIGNSYIV